MNGIALNEKRDSVLFAFHKPVLKVIGLGGGGCNAINRMVEFGFDNVEFISANTDHQSLKSSLAHQSIQLGPRSTRGLGSGGEPSVGREAALESRRELAGALEGADMVFLTAGMGGGTGTGAIPVVAKIAQSLGAVTIAVVTTPFAFEMGRRQRNATDGINVLQKFTDTLITIPNERLLEIAPHDLPMDLAFRMADDVLRQAVQGIAELITEPGLINVDFSNIRRLMQLGGGALMSMGIGEGQNRVNDAITKALNHPLLGSVPIDQASGVIANFSGGDLTLLEVAAAMENFHQRISNKADIVWGVMDDENLQGRAQVILVITGLGGTSLNDVMQISDKSDLKDEMVSSGRIKTRSVTKRSKVEDGTYRFQEAYPANQTQSETEERPIFRGIEEEAFLTDSTFSQSKNRQSRTDYLNNLDVPAFLRKRIQQNH